MFRGKWIADKADRAYGLAVRFFGVDISLLALAWVDEWRFIDLRLPCNYGLYLQLGCFILSVGRLADESIYEEREG